MPRQQTFTKDNVIVYVEGTLFMKVVDSHKSCYAIDQPLNSLIIAAQALVRSQVLNINTQIWFHSSVFGWVIQRYRLDP